MLIARIVCAVVGTAMLLFGASQVLAKVPVPLLFWVAVWLIGLLLAHDLVLAPATVGVGWLVSNVPARPRRYLQAWLIVAAMVTVVAIPLMVRTGSQPPAKAMLEQNYALHWVGVLAAVAVVVLLAYLLRRQRAAVPST